VAFASSPQPILSDFQDAFLRLQILTLYFFLESTQVIIVKKNYIFSSDLSIRMGWGREEGSRQGESAVFSTGSCKNDSGDLYPDPVPSALHLVL
jgi:hypothetical protein